MKWGEVVKRMGLPEHGPAGYLQKCLHRNLPSYSAWWGLLQHPGAAPSTLGSQSLHLNFVSSSGPFSAVASICFLLLKV